MVVGTKQIDQHNANVGQSHKADQMLLDAGFQTDPQTEIVLIQSKTHTASDPAFRAVVNDVMRSVQSSPAIDGVSSPYAPGVTGQISADRHSAMVQWHMKGDNAAATKRIDHFTSTTKAIAKAHPDFYVGEAGSISSGKAVTDAFFSQLGQAGERSVPLTLF